MTVYSSRASAIIPVFCEIRGAQ